MGYRDLLNEMEFERGLKRKKMNRMLAIWVWWVGWFSQGYLGSFNANRRILPVHNAKQSRLAGTATSHALMGLVPGHEIWLERGSRVKPPRGHMLIPEP